MNDEHGNLLGGTGKQSLPVFWRRTGKLRLPHGTRAFSLMEVILALAILAGAMTVLGQLINTGNRNAIAARDLSYAEMLCQSKMDEIRSGLAEPTAVTNATSETDANWVYSIETNTTDQTGLLALRVTFTQNTPNDPHPISFSLSTWIPDPGAEQSSTDSTSSDSSSSQ